MQGIPLALGMGMGKVVLALTGKETSENLALSLGLSALAILGGSTLAAFALPGPETTRRGYLATVAIAIGAGILAGLTIPHC